MGIVTERDPAKHAEMRRSLNSGFSERALRAQEPMIAACVDRFVERLGEIGGSHDSVDGVDIGMWFDLTTFDIIGSLAFGQDFGGIESGREHFWVAAVVKSMRLGAVADCFARFPFIATVIQMLFRGFVEKMLADADVHRRYCRDVIKK